MLTLFLLPIFFLINQTWEECVGIPPISLKYTTIKIEKPSIIERNVPQKVSMYIKNITDKDLRISRTIQNADYAYPVSLSSSFKIMNYLFDDYRVPDCLGCAIIQREEGLCGLVPSEKLKPGEEWKFDCNLIFNYDLLHYVTIFFGEVLILPQNEYDIYYIPMDIYNEDKSCFKKEINLSKYFWQPDEIGEVEIKLKNNCNEELYPAFDKSLYFRFVSRFDILDVIETNAKEWEKKDDWLIDFYFDHLKTQEEWYARIKVKAKKFSSVDYFGETMGVYLINEKDKNTGFSINENAFTFVWVCFEGGKK